MKRYTYKLLQILLVIACLLCLSSCESVANRQSFTSYKDLAGKRIACWSGSPYESAIKEFVPDAEVARMSVIGDMINSMYEGKVSAVCCNKSIYPNLKKEFNNLVCIDDFNYDVSYGTLFSLSSDGEALKNQYNAFLAKIKANGRYDELVEEWVGTPEHGLSHINDWDTSNGSLKVLCGYSTPPFVYIYNNEFSGFEFAIFAEFCEENHYRFDYENGEFNSFIASLEAGVCDTCISGFEITEERKKSVNFSDPIYSDKAVFYVVGSQNKQTEYTSLDELNGKIAGAVDGSFVEGMTRYRFPDNEIISYRNFSDAFSAVLNNKIDFIAVDSLKAKQVGETFEGLSYIEENIYTQEFGFFTAKDSERGNKLLTQLNEFIENNKDDIDALKDKWMSDLTDAQSLETDLDPNDEELIFGITGTSEPYTFIRNSEYVGLDVDVIRLFCKLYDYNLKIEAYDYSGLVPAVQTGKVDIGGSGIAITEERKQAVNFTITYCTDETYPVVRATSVKESFIDSLANSFYKNFIKEDRWLLILDGVLSTLRISFLSVLFGTLFGLIYYIISRNGNKIVNETFDRLSSLLDGLPMVVILMILYYVVFSSSNLSAEIVSIIAFSLTFSLGVYSMIKTAVKSIDIGQSEAAFSLGFSDIETFFIIIVPQALTQFMPNYKSAIVNLVKGTAVVGYIAVQDLTKASDMIRARTYEAFFPLISTAIIYLLLGKLLILLINSLEIHIEPQLRSKEKILRKYKK